MMLFIKRLLGREDLGREASLHSFSTPLRRYPIVGREVERESVPLGTHTFSLYPLPTNWPVLGREEVQRQNFLDPCLRGATSIYALG